jgi:hypothetical protein
VHVSPFLSPLCEKNMLKEQKAIRLECPRME